MAGLKRGARWRTVLWLRFTMWRHGLRSGNKLNTAVGMALNLLAVVASLALAVSFAKLFGKVAAVDDPDALRVCLYIDFFVLAFFAVVLPLFIGAGRRGLELPILTVFPIGRWSLFSLALATNALSGAHLFFWYPALVVTAVWGVVLMPTGLAAGMVILLVYAALLVLWGSVTLMLLEAMMQRRSVRELVGIAAFTVLMAVALVPALIDTGVIGSEDKPILLDILLEIIRPAVVELPPSVTAEALSASSRDQPGWPWITLLKLAAWALGGLLIGYWVFTKRLLEPATAGGTRWKWRFGGNSVPPGVGRRFDPFSLLPSTLAAVCGKELRYLTRSTPGKLVFLVSPLFVVMIGLAVGKLTFVSEPLFGIDPAEYAFYGVLLYIGLFSSNFLVNAYAWEGDGLKAYLMGPLPARHVILGKNVAVLVFQTMSLILSVLVWSVVRAVPAATTLTSGVFVFFCGLLILMAAGNFTSIAYPVRRSIASVTNSASNIGTLVSFGAVIASAALVMPALLLGMAAGGGAAQVLLLGLLVLALAIVNIALLDRAADLFEERSEHLMEALAGEAQP